MTEPIIIKDIHKYQITYSGTYMILTPKEEPPVVINEHPPAYSDGQPVVPMLHLHGNSHQVERHPIQPEAPVRPPMQPPVRSEIKKVMTGLTTPVLLSEPLCAFLGIPNGSKLSRSDVTRHICAYVKNNKLQNTQNKKNILPDAKLKDLLFLNDQEVLTYFNLQSFLKMHYLKSDADNFQQLPNDFGISDPVEQIPPSDEKISIPALPGAEQKNIPLSGPYASPRLLAFLWINSLAEFKLSQEDVIEHINKHICVNKLYTSKGKNKYYKPDEKLRRLLYPNYPMNETFFRSQCGTDCRNITKLLCKHLERPSIGGIIKDYSEQNGQPRIHIASDSDMIELCDMPDALINSTIMLIKIISWTNMLSPSKCFRTALIDILSSVDKKFIFDKGVNHELNIHMHPPSVNPSRYKFVDQLGYYIPEQSKAKTLSQIISLCHTLPYGLDIEIKLQCGMIVSYIYVPYNY